MALLYTLLYCQYLGSKLNDLWSLIIPWRFCIFRLTLHLPLSLSLSLSPYLLPKAIISVFRYFKTVTWVYLPCLSFLLKTELDTKSIKKILSSQDLCFAHWWSSTGIHCMFLNFNWCCNLAGSVRLVKWKDPLHVETSSEWLHQSLNERWDINKNEVLKAGIKNYRSISLLSHTYKIFTRIIQNI